MEMDSNHYRNRYYPKVTEGSLIMFPCYLEHFVKKGPPTPNYPRITIAFNLTVTKYGERTAKQIEISHSDNFLTETEQKIIVEYCLNAKYIFGETDSDEKDQVTGMTHNIPENEFVYKLFAKLINERRVYSWYETLSNVYKLFCTI